MTEKTKFTFSAVNNSNILIYHNRNPKIIPINELLNHTDHDIINEITNQKSNTKTIEYSVSDDIYIHTLNISNEIRLNKIHRFYEFQNIINLFEILPYSLPPFNLTSLNSIIDNNNQQQTIFYEDETEFAIKRNFKLLGNKIEQIDDIELSSHLGYLVGIFLGRGYIERKDKNLKGDVVLLGTKDNKDIIDNILTTKLHLSSFHKNIDGKIDHFTIFDNWFNEFFNNHFSDHDIPDWFYSAPYIFLNGFVHGFFQTNGTVAFNKENTKAFITFKVSSERLTKQLIELFINRYGFLTTFSLIPNKPFCKMSIKLTKELFGLLESGFSYKSIFNENKRELLAKSTGIYFSNPLNIPYRYRKNKKLTTGFNLFIPQCKGFLLNNGLFVSSIPVPLNNYKKLKNKQ